MKKIMYLLVISVVMFSCEKESVDDGNGNLSTEAKEEMFAFEDWKEFREVYIKFAKLSPEELEAQSFFSYGRDMDVSYAIQGILNEDNQFKLADKIIWFQDGKFYEMENNKNIENQKLNPKELKEVGSVSNEIVDSNGIDNAKSVVLTNQYEFNKQKYIENCGSGRVQGPSARKFKYVHEVVAELIVTGAPFAQVYQYSLYLRVKLEYNHKGRSWRLSGENRDISINIKNTSFFTNHLGTNYSTGSNSVYSVRFSNSCTSHQTIFLSEVNSPGPISGGYWNINIKGTITEKMFGDVERNRWRDNINW